MADAIEELTECLICAETFKDPLILPCLHTFCKKCVDKWKRGEQIKCPTCNAVTDVGAIKADFRVQKIMEALEQATNLALAQVTAETAEPAKPAGPKQSEGRICDLCSTNPIAHFCNECDQWLCDFCKNIHTKMKVSRSHSYTAVSGKAKAIKTTIQTKVDKIVQIQNDFQEAVRKYQAGVHDANGVQVAALRSCNILRSICQKELNSFFDSVHAQIIDFIGNSVSKFEAQLEQSKSVLSELIKQKEELEQIIARSDSTIATEGERLVENAKSYIESVKSPDTDIQLPVVNIERNLDWKKIEAATLHLSVREKKTEQTNPGEKLIVVAGAVGGTHSDDIKDKITGMSLREVSGKQWKKQQEVKLPSIPEALRVIKQQLWCCCSIAGIVIYDSDLQQQRTIPAGGMAYMHDVAEMSNGDLVIAALTGLFQFESKGSSIQNKVDSGLFTSVVIDQNQVFAAEYHSKIRVYSYRDNKWSKVRSFKASERNSDFVTLSVKNNQLKCCSSKEDKIRVYTMSGQLLQTYGKEGNGGAGQFNRPFLCSDDANGNLLVADRDNSRLQVMTEKGEFSLVQLQPEVTRPRSAVLFNNHLYVTSDSEKTLTKFAC